ncbi:hypothetical protein ACJDT4_03865 [Clostridium neuense]|uniref:Uncharacterized protein n=1 Tax=Clostridium neuense TaxID=1728934 RepID=A0ABW8TCU7_9CLOT
MLGKKHKGLEGILTLSKGIGENFFKFVNARNARESYAESLKKANN